MTEQCTRGCGNAASWWYREQWTCGPCYRTEEFPPGHYLTGDQRHFMGTGCNDCGAYSVSGMSLDEVDRWYRYGNVSQDLYEAYTHVWATGAVRFGGYSSWAKSPVIPEVVRLVAILRGVLTLKVTAKKPEPRAWSPEPCLPPPLYIDRI